MIGKPEIGLVGFGFVGRALHHGFAQTAIFRIFDANPIVSENTFEETIRNSEFIFICVPTPLSLETGKCDTSIIDKVLNDSVPFASNSDKIIIIKSTVIPGTTDYFIKKYPTLNIICNPEFLTERSYKLDFINASRVILGGSIEFTERVGTLYALRFPMTPICLTDPISAETVKYLSNCMLATKVALCNEFYDICEKLGIDYNDTMNMILMDGRIGKSHIDVPGHDGDRGFGGKCLIAGTKVLVDDRLINIEDSKVDDYIYGDGAYSLITKVGKRLSDTIKISSRGRELIGSEDHIHLIYKDDTLIETQLKDIKVGDWIYVLQPLNYETTTITLGKKPNNYIKWWKDKIDITPKLARVMGLYLSEGCKGIYDGKHTILWTIGKRDEYLADEIVSNLKEIGIHASKTYKESNGTYGISKYYLVRCRYQGLFKLFNEMNLGTNCYNKNSILIGGESAKSLIGGWLDGDGNIYKGTIEGYSESKDLITSIDSMLLALGINAQINKDGHCIRISMKEDVKEICSWTKRLKFNESLYKRNKSNKSPNMEKYRFGWITQVSDVSYQGIKEVYSLETSSHTYVANNILTHNCFPKDMKAMITKAEEVGCSPQIMKAAYDYNLKIRKNKDWMFIPGATSGKDSP
jgi:UDP-glucose 6-dehydrogenase